MARHRTAIIGYGHIARVQHRPCLEADPDFELVGVTGGTPSADDDIHVYPSTAELLANASVDAVVIATPPSVRYAIARDALLAGKQVLLEKPPAATLGEAMALLELASKTGRTVFGTWHSQYNLAVDAAAELFRTAPIRHGRVVWHEDVERYHAGQDWIWRPGGHGVFDAGINALSIFTRILPQPFIATSGTFTIDAGADEPIAVQGTGMTADGVATIELDFDWRVEADRRELHFELADGTIVAMPQSGRHLVVGGETRVAEEKQEYPRIYRRFHDLISQGKSDLDLEPLRVLADLKLVARRVAGQ